ncbi:B-cell differentiation antigen CD72 [Emydura macquarii macquarii]|uniref:B-cell differentiation antigen CD72 n=1 Tax=Emydura macquarii macquarii TaxID=1129001 RepID=UPI00352AAEF5
MAQSVTYADLRFVKAPLRNSTSSRSQEAAPAAEDDAELTYENVRVTQTVEVKCQEGVEQSTGHWWSAWYLPLGLLGACLVLLATSIGLGTRYWQLSQQLQQATRTHEAESSHLSQQVSTQEETLGQRASELERAQSELERAQSELEQARRELEQMELEGNSTQKQMQRQEAKLAETKEELARLAEEMREIKVKLNETELALSRIRPCEQTDCCPELWLLYRGKCLFVSREKKSWSESKVDCEKKSAQLLIIKPWNLWTMPDFLKNTDGQYWIGLWKTWSEGDWKWVEKSPSDK